VVNSNADLKNSFLQKLSSINGKMNPVDQLIIFIAAPGEEHTGDVFIAGQSLTRSEVAGAIHRNGATVLWSTASYSGMWLEGNVPWSGYMGPESRDESDLLVPSSSSYTWGGVRT
jgi:hypothetical protein